jgi:capsular polysaccharide transport system permease protein
MALRRTRVAIEPNPAFLHHRNVRVIDLFFARLVLEIAGASISLLLLSCLLCFTGLMMPPDDIFRMIVAWLLLTWFSTAMGLMIGSLSARWDAVDRVWHVIAYLFLPASGAFFMVDWLPSRVQEAAVLVPTVSCIELLREGYFGKTIHAHYELGYVVVLNTVLTLVALFSVRSVSGTVEGE